jgi:isopentenyl-diphosphate delta-isomerase
MTRTVPSEHHSASAPAGPTRPTTRAGRRDAAAREHVVLLDDRHRIIGAAAKSVVHHRATPLHLGFSCHVLDEHGRALLSRRASSKATWPGAWTNACCGHPAPGETLRAAVDRRLTHELGVTSVRMALALADFAYRAVMPDGTVEHELCPVVVATIDRPPRPNPDEVDDVTWLPWPDVCRRAAAAPSTLTPWSVEQLARLGEVAPALLEAGGADDRLLDRPPPFSSSAGRQEDVPRFTGPATG